MRPQLREGDDAFVAVQRADTGNGWCCICRGGQEKGICIFPDTVGDVDVKKLRAAPYYCSVWRGGDCGEGAGGVCCRGGDGWGGPGGSCGRAGVTLLLLQWKCTAL